MWSPDYGVIDTKQYVCAVGKLIAVSLTLLIIANEIQNNGKTEKNEITKKNRNKKEVGSRRISLIPYPAKSWRFV